jgi:hypothetical protein
VTPTLKFTPTGQKVNAEDGEDPLGQSTTNEKVKNFSIARDQVIL